MTIANPYIAIPLAAWLVAQILKVSLAAWNGRFDWRNFYVSGGMPSGHTAVVVSLAAVSVILGGSSSPLFGATAVLAAIVMYDSLGVRRATGEQAARLNQLIEHLTTRKLGPTQPQPALREVLGHQPLEVAAGGLIGLIVAILFNLNRLGAQGSWLSTAPSHRELIINLVVAVLVILAGLVGSLLARRGRPKSASLKRVTRAVVIMVLTTGVAGLILDFAAYQHALYLDWRLWSYLIGLVLVSWAGLVIQHYRSWLPTQLAEEANRARKARWLPRRRTKSR